MQNNPDEEWDLDKYLSELEKINIFYKGKFYSHDCDYPEIWDALCESITAYTDWQKDSDRARISSSLQDKINFQLKESIAIKASSNIEQFFINGLLNTVGEEFNYEGDINVLHPYNIKSLTKNEAKEIRNSLPKFMLNAIDQSVPSKCANPSWNNINRFTSKISNSTASQLGETLELLGLDKNILNYISFVRNKIAHGDNYGLLENSHLYYICWHSFEICILFETFFKGDFENNNYQLSRPTDEFNHNYFSTSLPEYR